MENPVLYIVIPCYNEQEVLPETSRRLKEKMESLMDRNMISRDSKIMFVNDGSKDHTIDILRDYESRYDNITVVDKENGGPSSARNRGLDLAKGEYVYFFDADDVLELDALEALYERAKEKKADLVIAKYDIFNRFQTFAVNVVFDFPRRNRSRNRLRLTIKHSAVMENHTVKSGNSVRTVYITHQKCPILRIGNRWKTQFILLNN